MKIDFLGKGVPYHSNGKALGRCLKSESTTLSVHFICKTLCKSVQERVEINVSRTDIQDEANTKCVPFPRNLQSGNLMLL